MSEKEQKGLVIGNASSELQSMVAAACAELQGFSFKQYPKLTDLNDLSPSESPEWTLIVWEGDLSEITAEISSVKKQLPNTANILLVRPCDEEQVAKLLDGYIHDYLVVDGLSPTRLSRSIVNALDRRQILQTSERNHKQLEAIFQHSNSVILLANDQGEYVDVNPAAARLLGYSQAELKKMKIANLVEHSSDSEFSNRWQNFLAKRQEDGIVNLRCKDGKIVIASYKAVADIMPGLHLSILNDITDQSIKYQQQRLLTDIYRITSQNYPLEKSIHLILKVICDFGDWEFGELWWTDAKNQHLILEGGHYDKLDDSFNDFISYSRQLDFILNDEKNLPLEAFRSGEIIFEPNINRNPLFRRKSCFPKHKIYSQLLIPLMKNGVGRGCVVLFRESGRQNIAEQNLLKQILKLISQPLGDELEHLRAKTTLSQVLQRSGDLIGTVNFQQQFTQANPALCATLGYQQHELESIKLADILPPAQNPDLPLIFEKAISGENIRMEDALVVARDGSQKWVEFSAIPNLRAGEIFFIGRDVTEHKLARQKLLAANQRYQLATKTSRMGIWEWQIDKDILKFDEGMASIYGLALKDTPQNYEQWFQFIHPHDQEEVSQAAKQAIEQKSTFDVSFRILQKNGEARYIRSIADICYDQEGQAERAIGVNWDVSEYVLSEKEKSKALAQLKERIKEQQCLYGISELQQLGLSVNEMLSRAVKLLPAGWQYPEITEAQIEFDSQVYATSGFQETAWMQITCNEVICGNPLRIKVSYREERPTAEEGPFLKEERLLLEKIAEQLVTGIDREHSKKKLQEKETRFRNLIEHNHDAIVVQDSNLKLSYASPSLKRVCGYSPDEVMSTEALEFVHPDDRHHREQKLQQILSGKRKRVSYKERIRHKDGYYLWVYVVVSDQRQTSGIEGLVFNFKDIDKEEKARRKLERSEAQLERAHKIAKLGSWWYYSQSGQLHWSKETYRLYGVDPERFVVNLSNVAALVHPDDRYLFSPEEVEARHRRANNSVEFRVIKPDGQLVWLEGQSSISQQSQGSEPIIEGVVQDITERKLTELQLEEREQRLRLFMENSPALSWIKDEEGRLMMANELFFKVTGRSKKHIGLDPAEYYSKEELDETRVNDLMVLKSGKSMQFMEKVRNAQGEQRVYEVYKFPVDIEGKFYLGAFALDVTENKEYQKAIEKQNKKLKQIAWVQSHIVRAPLARLMGLVELFRHHNLNEEDKKEVCLEIENSAIELDEIIKEMVATSKEIKVYDR